MSKELDSHTLDILKNYFIGNGNTQINIFELQDILKEIDSVENIFNNQSLIGLFWVSAIDKQVKFLNVLKPEIAAELLKSGLRGAPRQAGAAIKIIGEHFKDLIDTLKEDIFEAAQGDSIKICVQAGILLLQEVPEFISTRPWFIKRLSSVAEAPLPVKERLTLIELLCRKLNHQNYMQLEYYPDRDEVVEGLLAEGHHLALANYLRSAFNKWQPLTGDLDELIWLLETYKKIKAGEKDNEGELTIKGQAKTLSLRSKLVLQAATYEAAAAAADVIIRCINGPGGEHLWIKFADFMLDKDLAEEFMLAMSRDPKALALLAEDMKLNPQAFNLSHQEVVSFLTYGVLAAQYCLKEILKLCLNIALQNNESGKLCMEKLKPEKDQLYQYASELFEKIIANTEAE
ncbi:hypothetical protein [Desulfolucanica intricata]|uniref:hypothetical protein n=1 Tax=Desulfolucanica intricata TaxID=1285191 RepID=UPI00083708D8|nr:hypothetical protein [Desulfolucanica intricata]